MSRIPTDIGWENDFGEEDQTLLNQAFQPVTPKKRSGPLNPFIGIGDLVRFQYTNWKHDPYPMIIVHDSHFVYPTNPGAGDHLRGVNLNYLTMSAIVYMGQNFCGSQGFNYGSIVGRRDITAAFRTYKRANRDGNV